MSDPIEPVVVSVTRTARDHRRSVRANRRRALWRMRIVAILLLVGGSVVVATAGAFFDLLGLPLVLTGVGLLVGSWLLPRTIVQRLPSTAFVPHQIEISTKGIRLSSSEVVDEYPWHTFVTASRARHMWILRHLDQGPPTMLARRYFTKDQEARLEAMLRAQGLLA